MTSLHDRTARLREAVVPGWLAEAIALAGNTKNSKYFSFLTRDRFLGRPKNLDG